MKKLTIIIFFILFSGTAYTQNPVDTTKNVSAQHFNNHLDDYIFFKNLDDNTMLLFLFSKDLGCYYTFNKGVKFSKIGKGILIPGAILTVGGVVFTSLGYTTSAFSLDSPALTYLMVGFSALAVGVAATITSIPLLVKGKKLKTEGKTMYEEKYFKGTSTSLHLNVHPTGLGLSLKF